MRLSGRVLDVISRMGWTAAAPACSPARMTRQFALRPWASMKVFRLLSSFFSRVCSAEPGPNSGVISSSARRWRTIGDCKAFAMAFSSLSFTSAGMPFGPKTPNQNCRSTSACLMPASAKVGTSGKAGERSLPVTAKALIRLASTKGLATWLDAMMMSTWPAMAAIIAGHVDIIMASSQVAKPLVEAKRIKAFAVTGKERSPALPDVPTLAEAGIKHADVDLQFWFGVFGPKGMPADVKDRLEKAIAKALQSPMVRQRLAELDITPEFGPGSALQTRLKNEINNWKTFIEAKGLKAN